jgi:hypothetical protein
MLIESQNIATVSRRSHVLFGLVPFRPLFLFLFVVAEPFAQVDEAAALAAERAPG